MVEKRRDKRYLVQNLVVFMRDSDERLGNVINLSLGGMLISHDDAIAVESVLEIRLPLGHGIDGHSDFIADVQIMWLRQNDISGLFGLGLQFLDNTEEQRAMIQEIINTFS